jgi:soluble lytic murein transglycosylase
MLKLLCKLLLVIALAAIAACGLLICTSADPLYTTESLLSHGRYHRFDALIRQVGAQYGVDPMLIKAVVWRESGFRPGKVGTKGERGLMQVTEAAASDWARQTKRSGFVPTDLFTPLTNLETGTWYLKKALQRYAGKDDPATFALAEYNAGKSHVDKWVDNTNQGAGANAGDLRDSISFPGTREYVDIILDRYHFYQRQGHL